MRERTIPLQIGGRSLRNTFAHAPFRGVPMTFEDVRRLDGLPAMWAVLLYQINQSEERDRILRDWEDVVFGPGLRQERGLGIAALSDVLGDRDR